MPLRRGHYYLVLAIVILAVGLGLRAFTDKTKYPVATVSNKGPQKTQTSGTPAIGGAFTAINQNGNLSSAIRVYILEQLEARQP